MLVRPFGPIAPVLLTLMVCAAAGCQSAPAAEPPFASAQAAASPGAAAKAKLPPGYLPRAALPDSLALLPPPPAPGSAAMKRDEEARQSVAALRGTLRWNRAASDAKLTAPQIHDDFSCAVGVAISKDTTPTLYALIARMMVDVGLSTYRAKTKYQRTRPFIVHGDSTCAPEDEAMLRNDGSYPSGHSALGWGWALALAEISPDRADAILQRGHNFGQSRLVCNVHWQSDIDAGRVIAAATVARLHADPAFRADLDKARTEVAAAQAMGSKPKGDCAAEAASLALR